MARLGDTGVAPGMACGVTEDTSGSQGGVAEWACRSLGIGQGGGGPGGVGTEAISGGIAGGEGARQGMTRGKGSGSSSSLSEPSLQPDVRLASGQVGGTL